MAYASNTLRWSYERIARWSCRPSDPILTRSLVKMVKIVVKILGNPLGHLWFINVWG